MSDLTRSFPLPDRLDIGPAPHVVGGDSFNQITRSTLAVACMVGLVGIALFGRIAAIQLTLCLIAAVVSEWFYMRLTEGRAAASFDHAALIGILVGLTLPVGRCTPVTFQPTDSIVPVVATTVAVVVGKGLMGGMGNYLWHPALVGRVAAEVFYSDQLHPKHWPLLGYTHLFSGTPQPALPTEYFGWRSTELPQGANAWSLTRPADWLRRLAEGGLVTGDENPLTVLVRDYMPPWEDTLLGGVGGNIGETCTLALIVGGLYMIYRGHVRWQQPVSVLVGAALAVLVLPIRAKAGDDLLYLPGLQVDQGLPVGLLYLLYHLTGGDLMLGAFLFATDTVASPRTTRGQVIFGAGMGALTIVFRLYGSMFSSCYWAIILMNTMVDSIDRRTKRRVMGTPLRSA